MIQLPNLNLIINTDAVNHWDAIRRATDLMLAGKVAVVVVMVMLVKVLQNH
jgi:hypothetical protein